MATFLAGMTDIESAPQLFTPDYDFLRYTLQKRQQNYDQGVSDLANSYQSILNAPLTNEELKKSREQYLKQANDSLKIAASSDLSLPQNQQFASGIYAPFWNDTDMLKDMNFTKQQNSEIERQYAMQNDEKNKEFFSTIPIALMQDRTDKVRKAKKGDVDVYNEPIIKATPFYNLFKDAENYLKNNPEGWKVEKTDVANGRIITVKNGQGAVKSFQEFANSLRGEKYRAQDEMMGKYQTLDAINNIKTTEKLKTGIDVTDDKARSLIPEYYAGSIIESLKKSNEQNSDELILKKKQYIDIKAKNINHELDVEQKSLANDIKYLSEYISSNTNNIKLYKNKTSDKYQELANNLIFSPERYFAEQYKQNDILRTARVLAENQSEKIEEDKAQSDHDRLNMEWRIQQDKEMNENKRAAEKNNLLRELKTGKSNGRNGVGSTQTGEYDDVDENGVSDKKENPYNTPEINIQSNAVKMNNSVIQQTRNWFNENTIQTTQSLFHLLHTNSNLLSQYLDDDADIAVLQSGMLNNGVPTTGFDQKQYDDVTKKLSEKIKALHPELYQELNGPITAASVLAKIIQKDGADAIQNAKDYPQNSELREKADSYIKSLNIINSVNNEMNKLYNDQSTFEKRVNDIAKNDKYSDIRIKDGNGKYTFVSPQLLASKYNIPIDVADSYIKGDLKTKDVDDYDHPVPVNNKINFYNLIRQDPPSGDPTSQFAKKTVAFIKNENGDDEVIKDEKGKEIDITKLVDSYGNPKDFAKKYNEKMSSLTDDTGELKDVINSTLGDTLMSKSVTYLSDENEKPNKANLIASEILNTLNLEKTEDGYVKNYSDDQRKFAELLFNRIKGDPKKGLSSITYSTISPINPDRRSVLLKYSMEEINKLLTDKEKESKEYKNFKNDGFLVELKPSAEIKNISFQDDKKGYYENLLDMHPNKIAVRNTDIEEKLGLRYSFMKNLSTGVISFHVETESVEPDNTNPNNVIHKWNRLGDNWNPLMNNQTVDSKIQELQSKASEIYFNNSAITSKFVPHVKIQSLGDIDKETKEIEEKYIYNKK